MGQPGDPARHATALVIRARGHRRTDRAASGNRGRLCSSTTQTDTDERLPSHTEACQCDFGLVDHHPATRDVFHAVRYGPLIERRSGRANSHSAATQVIAAPLRFLLTGQILQGVHNGINSCVVGGYT
jgi:hypothetical protein